jgi:O-antigen/teichoic acid export membrane protein
MNPIQRISPLRRQSTRKLIVAVNILFMLLMLTASQLWPEQPWRAGLDLLFWGLLGVLYLMLRKSVRHMSDAPNDLLDERQIQVRDASYLIAYRILATVTLSAILLFSIFLPIHLPVSFKDAWMALYVSYLMFSIGLPAMVLAWNLPNEDDEEGR